LRFVKYIRVARSLAPGAHFLQCCNYVLGHSFVAYRLVPFIAYCTISVVVYRFVRSRGLIFASEFLTVARIVLSSFRAPSCLRFAYCPVFVSRIIIKLRLISSIDHRVSYRSLRFTIADGFSRDSAIPGATSSSHILKTFNFFNVYNSY